MCGIPREEGQEDPKGRRPPRAAGHPEACRSPSTGGGPFLLAPPPSPLLPLPLWLRELDGRLWATGDLVWRMQHSAGGALPSTWLPGHVESRVTCRKAPPNPAGSITCRLGPQDPEQRRTQVAGAAHTWQAAAVRGWTGNPSNLRHRTSPAECGR